MDEKSRSFYHFLSTTRQKPANRLKGPQLISYHSSATRAKANWRFKTTGEHFFESQLAQRPYHHKLEQQLWQPVAVAAVVVVIIDAVITDAVISNSPLCTFHFMQLPSLFN